ncbi:major facilitator superfamily domain-containing protein [Gigaspora rosea]|uniref:Major facilitator superfamily domain-containing protein n=1 Tax=Gigaspora rosea TaxID=44941 RepID=A0A397U714_9GLOM|nr:major facilitator superfamily domain-containing protein [Gigaspora rosea]
MDIENNQLHDGKNEPSLENEKTETESTSLNDPMNWSIKKKQFIVFIISSAGAIAPISGTIFFPAITKIGVDLNTSQILANSIISTFILLVGITPLGWASYSDTRETRRRVYLISLTIYVVASIICAISNNIWQLLAMRTFQAFGGSAVQSIGAGTISDIFIPTERGRAFGWFNLGPIAGPVIGPAIGGYITQYLGWRFIFLFLSLYGGAILVIIYFALPETFRHIQLSLTTTPLPKKRFNPFLPLALLHYPNLSLPILYISMIFSVMYVQSILVPKTFSAKFNLSPSNIGLVFLSPGIGYSLGSVVSGSYSDFILAKNRKKYGSIYPEMRISSIWFGSVLVPVSLLAYGWFIVKNVHISLPILSMFFFGFGAFIVFSGSSTYLIDAFPGQSASAIAVNNCFRFTAASIMSLASVPLENVLGTGLLYTLLAIFITLGTSCMVIVYFKGKEWTERFQK